MDILRARRTRRCVYLLVRCPCGRQFGHPARRRLIICYWCGRIADAAQRRRMPFARPAMARSALRSPLAGQGSDRRPETTPAARG